MADPADTPRSFETSDAAENAERRSFLVHTATVLVSAVAGVVPLLSGLVVFFDPLKRGGPGARAINVAPLEAVPDDGLPHQFPVIADRQDAWNRFVNVPIGSVYLLRQPGAKKVQALNASCPHAGCNVSYLDDKQYFRCPCHESAFDLAGKRLLEISDTPPRDMDELPCQVKKNRIMVEFQNYYTGRPEKVPKA